jgi:macrodomain Ter protein organizer (MatP/YcbG family)
MENISNNGFCLDIEFLSQRFKKLDEFLEELKKSVDIDGIVYINKTTWANRLSIDRKTLSDYINQFIDYLSSG